LPVFIRITRSFAYQKQQIEYVNPSYKPPSLALNSTILPRFVPTPSNAVDKHQELIDRIIVLKKSIPLLGLTKVLRANSDTGIIACGHLISKLKQAVEINELSNFTNTLLIENIYPIDEKEIVDFLIGLDKVIVLEENTPVISDQLKVIAANQKIQLHWQSISYPGEVFRWQIVEVLRKEFPGIPTNPKYNHPNDEKLKIKGNCNESRYNEVLNILDTCSINIGKSFKYYGDPGCLVAVSHRLQGKFAMGGSVATVFGTMKATSDIINISLVGDSGFFHSALLAICDAAYHNANFPIILLNNSAALTTGGQNHPGVNKENSTQRLNYQAILKSCGIGTFQRVNLNQPMEELLTLITDSMQKETLRFLQIDIE